ncbi:MAG: VanZ family protein [Clostridia bacterium]|nr:VanZ family protein [Clostridia bacterium]
MTKDRKILINILRISIPILLTVLWLCFIYGNSLQTGVESGEQSGRVYELVNSITQALGLGTPISEHFIRKAAHFTEFAILGVLVCADLWACRAITLEKRLYISASILLCSVPICALFASLDEFLQSFVDGRGPSAKDVLIDASGALCATILFVVFFVITYIFNKKYVLNNAIKSK